MSFTRLPKMRMTMKRETTAGIFFVFLILVSGRPAAAQMDTNPGRLTSDYLFRKFKSADSDNNHIDTFDGHGQLQTGNKDLVSELVSVVTKLQDRVTQLERQSSEDKTLLKLLHQQQQSGGAQGTKDGRQSSDAIGRLEAQMTSLKSDLSELVASKERDVERSEDIRELRLEFDGVNSECQKLRMEVQSLKDRREEDVKRYGQQRNSQMTIKWLQKTMQEVRKEMTELAAVQNVSAAIRQQQQYETGLSLLRSDVVALRTQVEECRVSQDRDQAALIQVQQDVQDLRNQHHTMAANAQLFREELSQFKDELQALSATTNSRQPLQDFIGQGKNSEGQQQQQVSSTGVTNHVFQKGEFDKLNNNLVKTAAFVGNVDDHPNDVIQVDLSTFFSPQTHHRLRHHSKLREEVLKLKSVVQLIYQRQTEMDRKVNVIRHNQTTVDGDVRHLWGRMADLLNATRSSDAKRVSLERSVADLQKITKGYEQRLVNNDKVLHDLNDSVAGIDKLHSSTVQLFESLEALEDEYSKRIDDLLIEVSKFEFNMAQLTSTVDLLKEDQRNHYDALKAVRSDVSGLHQNIEKNEYKLVALRSEVVVDEARRIFDPRIDGGRSPMSNGSHSKIPERNVLLELESRVSNLGNQFLQQTLQYSDVLDKLSHKADLKHVAHWASSADLLNEAIANLSQKLESQQIKMIELEDDIHKMYHHFPSECSQVMGPTGMYQLYPWNESSLTTALCDMDTDGGGWTVIQQHRGSSPKVDFDRDWHDYKTGFGRVDTFGDFWIGNDILHHLTNPKTVEMRIDMWDTDGGYHYVQYDAVRVSDADHAYALHIGERVRGNVSDALRYHNGMKFSTRDVDNDFSSQNCAREYEGGWWYNHCQHVNINGKYAVGLSWYDEDNNTMIQIQRTQMKIRPSKAIKS